MENLTQKEHAVIKAYINDDFVSDHGFESNEASAWLEDFHKDAGINETSFPGVMSSLVKKGIINTNGESFNLTEKGTKIAKKISKDELRKKRERVFFRNYMESK